MNSSERLQKLVEYLQITYNQLSVEIGFKKNTKIYHIKNGRNNISADIAKRICDRFPEVNYLWLFQDKGDMLSSTPKKENESEEPGAIYTTARERELLNEIEQLKAQIEFEKRRAIEYIDTDNKLNELKRNYNKLFDIIVLLVGGNIKDAKKQLESVEGKSE